LHFRGRVLAEKIAPDRPEPDRLPIAERESVAVRREPHEARFARHLLIERPQIEQRRRLEFVRRIVKGPGLRLLGDGQRSAENESATEPDKSRTKGRWEESHMHDVWER